MKVVVKLFAGVREIVGKDEITIEMAGNTVGELRACMVQHHAELQPLLAHALFALDTTYCNNETTIPENAVVACIPPVSGG